MKEEVIIVGAGGHAKIVIDILQELNQYKILGVTSKKKIKRNFMDCLYWVMSMY